MLDAPYLLNIPGAGSREWLEKFTSDRRKAKVRLAFLCLLNSQGLGPILKEELGSICGV
nr:hypothetical protein [uncultured Acetatifactor sp.]